MNALALTTTPISPQRPGSKDEAARSLIPFPGAPPVQLCFESILVEIKPIPREHLADFVRQLEGRAQTIDFDLKHDPLLELTGKKRRARIEHITQERLSLAVVRLILTQTATELRQKFL